MELWSQVLVYDEKIPLPAEVIETSGMEWINDSVWVTHNDSGDEPKLYFLDKKGQLKSTVKLNSAYNGDWEDISYDEIENIFIGDLGNNLNNRKDLKIYSYNINDSSVTSFPVNYADQKFPTPEKNKNFDCEAIVYSDKQIFAFTKNYTEPFNGYTKVYSFGTYGNDTLVSPIDSFYLGDGGLWKHAVTSADFSSEKQTLALLTYKYLYLFYDFTGNDFFGGKYMQFLLPEIQQREAVCFDAIGNIWMTDENSRLKNGGFLYRYDMQKIYKGDFFFRNPEIGIVTVKSKKGDKTDAEGIRNLQIQAQITNESTYTIEILKEGRIIYTKDHFAKGKLKDELKFAPDDTYTELFYIRIYNGQRLIYANKVDVWK